MFHTLTKDGDEPPSKLKIVIIMLLLIGAFFIIKNRQTQDEEARQALNKILAEKNYNVTEERPAVIPREVERPTTPQEYAKKRVIEKWGEEQWEDFNKLIMKESGWNPKAQNPRSTAYGLGQFLNSTWKLVGCEKSDDFKIQIDCTIDYIAKGYETPQKALQFHRGHNYY